MYWMIFPTWRMDKMAAGSCNSIAKYVNFLDEDCRYYIISGHNFRKYFNVLQHEQDKFILCIKLYRLLWFSRCNDTTPFKMFGRISGGYGTKCITQSEAFN